MEQKAVEDCAKPKARQQSALRASILHLVCLAPAVVLAIGIATNRLGADPIGEATRRAGRYAILLLLASLTVTPLRRISGRQQIMRARKPLGLYAFGYAALHLGIYLGWDYGFAFRYALEAARQSPFIWAGAAALLILLALAVTSTRGWQRRLGRRWRALHRLVYLAGALVGLHYAWVYKELRALPLVYLGVLALLLALRVPAVSRLIAPRVRAG